MVGWISLWPESKRNESAQDPRKNRDSGIAIPMPAPTSILVTRNVRISGRPAMIPALNIYRAANVLIKRHGEDAPIQAAMRADAMLKAGDLDGYAVLKRILRAVEELQRAETPPGFPNGLTSSQTSNSALAWP